MITTNPAEVLLLPCFLDDVVASSAVRTTSGGAGAIRKSRGRVVRGSIEPSIGLPPCGNSHRGLRDNGVEESGYSTPGKIH